MDDHLNQAGDQLTTSVALAEKESLNKMTIPSKPVQPPPQLHPLHILDTYLASILKNHQNGDYCHGANTRNISNQHCDINSILQTCEFLFSQSFCPSSSHSSYSLLESALELLDDSSSNSGISSNYQQNHDVSSPSHSSSTRSDFIPAVRLIRSSSGRSMIIVRGSSSSASSSSSSLSSSLIRTSPNSPLSLSNAKTQATRWGNHNSNNSYNNDRKNSSQNQHSCSEYLITLGTNIMDTSAMLDHNDGNGDNSDNDRNKHKFHNGLDDFVIGKMGYHCTCRSFYERLKRPRRPSNSNSSHDHDRFVICKHLLAARIAPFLHCEGTNSYDGQENDGTSKEGQHFMQSQSQSQQQHGGKSRILCYREEEVTDGEFARMYINLSMNLWT